MVRLVNRVQTSAAYPGRLASNSASKSVYSLVFPSALAFAHLALAAADSLALTAGLLRQSFLAGLDLAFPFAFALAHRIFRALPKAFMSLRRWTADM